MKKKIGIFWLRDDFRIAKNLALAYATKNHNRVVVLYLFKKKICQSRSTEMVDQQIFK